jgi:hypothetical protein
LIWLGIAVIVIVVFLNKISKLKIISHTYIPTLDFLMILIHREVKVNEKDKKGVLYAWLEVKLERIRFISLPIKLQIDQEKGTFIFSDNAN